MPPPHRAQLALERKVIKRVRVGWSTSRRMAKVWVPGQARPMALPARGLGLVRLDPAAPQRPLFARNQLRSVAPDRKLVAVRRQDSRNASTASQQQQPVERTLASDVLRGGSWSSVKPAYLASPALPGEEQERPRNPAPLPMSAAVVHPPRRRGSRDPRRRKTQPAAIGPVTATSGQQEASQEPPTLPGNFPRKKTVKEATTAPTTTPRTSFRTGHTTLPLCFAVLCPPEAAVLAYDDTPSFQPRLSNCRCRPRVKRAAHCLSSLTSAALNAYRKVGTKSESVPPR
ncbi:uncharacterized protein PV09_08325 [Verruconis gallopava]|uniref:Uncharacterized protein n=1 Tax=Verruconis gallopava TaxID=253628 RepID=A0A0D2ALZ6_9PEZI|nr:uncharacterized protein PV09_08325 [Verruconis gallopava]KIW00149.1 hypothetical protein PV09_08325 [Verruconis gallopava]